MKNSLTIILLIVILAIIAIVLTVISDFPENNSSINVNITVEKSEYTTDEIVKVKIQNNSEEKACLSSAECYLYYLERKVESKWEAYPHSDCQVDNLVQLCIDPKGMKTFELISISSLFPDLAAGETYRLAIPICVNCNIDESFKEDKWFYSNEFIIK